MGDVAALLWHPPGVARLDADAPRQEASGSSRGSGASGKGRKKAAAAVAVAVEVDPAACMPGSAAAGKMPVLPADTIPAPATLHAVTPMRLLCCAVGQVLTRLCPFGFDNLLRPVCCVLRSACDGSGIATGLLVQVRRLWTHAPALVSAVEDAVIVGGGRHISMPRLPAPSSDAATGRARGAAGLPQPQVRRPSAARGMHAPGPVPPRRPPVARTLSQRMGACRWVPAA